MNNSSWKRDMLLALFITSILVANTIASKLINVWGVAVTAGIITYPLTFAFTDIVGEVFGKQHAQRFVMAGFLANLLMVGLYSTALALPFPEFWKGQAAFNVVLGAVPRIVLASMIAYLVSQTHDVWLFHLLRAKMEGRHLWVRNNLSTMLSQTIDSAIFITIAFVGTMPVTELTKMFVNYLVIKYVIAVCDTPFVYLGVRWLKGDMYERAVISNVYRR